MKRNIFLVNDFDKQFILEMHKKATQKNYVNFNIIEEQKQNAKTILSDNGFSPEEANEIAKFFRDKDKSQSQANAKFSAKLYVNSIPHIIRNKTESIIRDTALEQRIVNIMNAYNKINTLNKKNNLYFEGEKMILSLVNQDNKDEKIDITNANINEFERIIKKRLFLIDPKAGKSTKVEVKKSDLIYDDENFSFYTAFSRDSCIRLTQGGVNEKKYSFCIGDTNLANNQFDNYRFGDDYKTFYFIHDKNAEAPSRVIVYGLTKSGQYYLTDELNNTGTLQLYGSGGTGAANLNAHLKQQGVKFHTIDVFGKKMNVPLVTNEPNPEDNHIRFNKQNAAEVKKHNFMKNTKGKINDLESFAKLPYNMKKLYISAGNTLTDEQFDYLLGGNLREY